MSTAIFARFLRAHSANARNRYFTPLLMQGARVIFRQGDQAKLGEALAWVCGLTAAAQRFHHNVSGNRIRQ